MSAYLRTLNAAAAAAAPPPPPALEVRLEAWLKTLPAFTRERPFSMAEFELALSRPGRLISPALLSLGWQRKRRWDSRGHYHRYWIPPEPYRRKGIST